MKDSFQLLSKIISMTFILSYFQITSGCNGDGGPYESEKQHCIDVLNSYREQVGKPPLSRSKELEQCADEAAKYDSSHPSPPHAHFRSTNGCNGLARAENELPGWPLEWYGSINEIIESGTELMWSEGPGGGHYENITGNYTQAGCGIYIDNQKDVWIVQDFR